MDCGVDSDLLNGGAVAADILWAISDQKKAKKPNKKLFVFDLWPSAAWWSRDSQN